MKLTSYGCVIVDDLPVGSSLREEDALVVCNGPRACSVCDAGGRKASRIEPGHVVPMPSETFPAAKLSLRTIDVNRSCLFPEGAFGAHYSRRCCRKPNLFQMQR